MRAALLILASATLATAQSAQLPDCRIPWIPVGTACQYNQTGLPSQKVIGALDFPGSQRGKFTEPATSVIAPAETHYHVDLTALGTFQTETTDMSHDNSTGLQLELAHPLNFTRSVNVALRGEIIHFRGIAGAFNENNHTEEVVAGPKLVQRFGRLSTYEEALVGAGYQYRWGMPLSGNVGLGVKVSNRLTLIPADLRFERYFFQPESSTYNSRTWRAEASLGFAYSF